MSTSREGDNRDYKDEKKLVILKNILLQKVNWEIQDERHQLLDQLSPLINTWNDRLPDLRDIFKPDEIERLLEDSVDINSSGVGHDNSGQRFASFVARSGYKDEPEVDEDGRPLLRRTTPIHRASKKYKGGIIPSLFTIYDRFDANPSDESGFTHFHVACQYGSGNVVEKFLVLGRVDPNCLVPGTGDSPLHLALKGKKRYAVESLLRHGADPGLANEEGSTPLHVVCNYKKDDDLDNLAKKFFKVNDEIGRKTKVRVDVQDKKGRTPLLLALQSGNAEAAEWLLRRGAEPNIANAEGETPLHVVSKREDLAELFFKITDEMNHTLRLDARGKWGNAPLHLAVLHRQKNVFESLLRRGADPNVANAQGETPLHIICKRYELYDGDESDLFFKIIGDMTNNTYHYLMRKKVEMRKNLTCHAAGSTPLKCIRENYSNDGLAKIFLEICEEVDRPVQVDAKDNRGRTPLQLAVANLLPLMVGVLLNNDADLSSFVFPTESDFDDHVESYKSYKPQHSREKVTSALKVEVISGALGVVQRLEKKRYKLSRSDVATMMKFFAKHGLLDDTSTDRLKNWYSDERFTTQAKKIMIKPALSLYDFVRLRPDEAAKRFTYAQFKTTLRLLGPLPKSAHLAVEAKLASILLRGFYRRWGLNSFMELTRHRLPILCAEMIIEKLSNEDLSKVCLVAAGRSS